MENTIKPLIYGCSHLLLKRQIHWRFDGTFGNKQQSCSKKPKCSAFRWNDLIRMERKQTTILTHFSWSCDSRWEIVMHVFLTASLDTFRTHYCEWVVETTGWNDKLFDFQSPFGVGEKPPLFGAMSEANKEEIDRCKQSLAWCGGRPLYPQPGWMIDMSYFPRKPTARPGKMMVLKDNCFPFVSLFLGDMTAFLWVCTSTTS